MSNEASVNIFDDKNQATATLKVLTGAGFDASMIGPVDLVAVADHYGPGDKGFETPAGAKYYVVTGWNKT